MKRIVCKYLILLCCVLFASIHVTAQVIKKDRLTNVKFPVKIGDNFMKNYTITEFCKSTNKKSAKKINDNYNYNWKPYDIGYGIYERSKGTALTQIESFKTDIFYSKTENDTVAFKINNFITVNSGEKDNNGKDIFLSADIIFLVNQKNNNVVIPTQDLGITTKITNKQTGEEYFLECFVGDVVTTGVRPKYDDYVGIANFDFGLFEYHPYYYCEMGGFGNGDESFILGNEPIWSDEENYAVAEWKHAFWNNENLGGVIDDGIQKNICVFAQTYRPQPSIKKLRFENWGKGFWTKDGFDLFVILDDKDTASIKIPNTDLKYQITDAHDHDIKYDFFYISPICDFYPDFPIDMCHNIYNTEKKIGYIFPYIYCENINMGFGAGWASVNYDNGKREWHDEFYLHPLKEEIAVQSVELNKKYVTVSEGETVQLNVTVLPENASNKKIIWKSTDFSVATVINGIITANSTGETSVVVKSSDGTNVSDTCRVNVLPIPKVGDNFESDGLYFTVTSKTTCEVTYEYQNAMSYSGDIIIPDSVEYCGKMLTVTSIGSHAFYYCANLKSIDISNSVEKICDCAFANCTGLTNVSVGNSVKSIEQYAFLGCSGLKNIVIPNSVTSIGQNAFEDCTNLECVTIPNTALCGDRFIDDCNSLNCININIIDFSRDNTIYPQKAFNWIKYHYYYNNEEITGSYKLPKDCKTLGEYLLAACEGLTSVTIPQSINTIEKNAFLGCSNLKDVYLLWKEPKSVSNEIFGGIPTTNIILKTLHIPYGSKDKYENIEPWKYFWDIVDDAMPILTVTADNKSRMYAEYNPVFTYTLSGLKDKDAEDDVFTDKPVLICNATKESLPGIYTIEVSGAASDDYVIEYVSGILTINKLAQQIIWNQNIPALAPGGELCEISATASSGLDVSFSSSDDNVANLFYLSNKWYINPLENGTVEIIAKQEGNNIFNAADTVKKTVIIDPNAINDVEVNDKLLDRSRIYDLMGRKVGKDYKGIVVVNGKKKIIK